MTDNQDSRLEAISRKLYQVPLNLNAHEIASLVYRSINDQSNSEYSKLQYQLLLLEGKVRKGEYGEVSKQVREDLRHIHELFSDFGEFIVFESAITEELESGVMEALPEDPTYQDVRSLSFRIIEGLYSKKAHRITGKLASINLKARDKPEGYENMNPDLLANLNSLKKLMFNYVNTIRYAESLLSEDLFPYLKLSASVFKLREDLSLSDVVKDSKIIYADDDEHWKSRTLFVFEDIGYESIIAEDRFKALEEFLNSSYGLETGTTISAKGDNGTVTYTYKDEEFEQYAELRKKLESEGKSLDESAIGAVITAVGMKRQDSGILLAKELRKISKSVPIVIYTHEQMDVNNHDFLVDNGIQSVVRKGDIDALKEILDYATGRKKYELPEKAQK